MQRLFDVVGAGALLVLTLPLLAATAAAVAITDGRPILYRGVRLGQGRRRFTISKFRTLVIDAEQRLGAQLESRDADLRTPLGCFLRDTRLDELPQLWNILRGDMTFVGPRPERPAVYEQRCRTIERYEDRFLVPPGLVGYAQLMTPHGAPKQMRARIDNRFVHAPPGVLHRLWLVALTAGAVVRSVAGKLHRELRRKLRRRPERRRGLRHAAASGSRVLDPERRPWGEVIDANGEVLRVRALAGGLPQQLLLQVASGHGPDALRYRRAWCRVVEVFRRQDLPDGDLLVRYEPTTEMSEYVVDQYLLGESMVRRRRTRLQRSA